MSDQARGRRARSYVDEAPGAGMLAHVYRRTTLAAVGMAGTAAICALLAVSVATFTHAFAHPATVELDLPRAGAQLSSGADVKLHGLIVGRVSSIEADPDGSGATVSLALDRDQLKLLPSNVTAQVLPKTLFGEKFIDLDLPAAPSNVPLADGAVIDENRSAVALETRTVLNDLEPLLTAIDPADLDTALTAVATAVQGRGTEIGNTIDSTAAYARASRTTASSFVRSSGLLGEVTDAYATQAPHLLHTLGNLTVAGKTLTSRSTDLHALLYQTDQLGQVATQFTSEVGPTGVELARVSRPVLELLSRYSPEIACTVRAADKAVSRLDASFSSGPYLKARYFVQTGRGVYLHGKDDPSEIDLSPYGPYCPATPRGETGTVPNPPLPAPLRFLRGDASVLHNAADPVPLATSVPGAAAGGPEASDLLQMLLGPVAG